MAIIADQPKLALLMGVERYLMRFALIALFGGLSPPALAVANYTMGSSIGLPGADFSEGLGVNASGQVTGYSSIAQVKHAFLYANGVISDLGTLGGTTGTGYAINATGQVVGSSSIANGSAVHAFLYANGRMTDLGTLGGTNSEALAINDSGQIVGDADTGAADSNGNPVHHAFLYTAGKMTDLGTLGGPTSVATGINANNQIIGYSDTAAGPLGSSRDPFLYADGKMTDWVGALPPSPIPPAPTPLAININAAATGSAFELAVVHGFLYTNGNVMAIPAFPGGRTSVGRAINSHGDVVGAAEVGPEVPHAFIFTNGTIYDLNTLFDASATVTLFNAEGINDSGDILVQGSLGSGRYFAAVLTPDTNSQPTGGGCASVANLPSGSIDPMFPTLLLLATLGLLANKRSGNQHEPRKTGPTRTRTVKSKAAVQKVAHDGTD